MARRDGRVAAAVLDHAIGLDARAREERDARGGDRGDLRHAGASARGGRDCGAGAAAGRAAEELALEREQQAARPDGRDGRDSAQDGRAPAQAVAEVAAVRADGQVARDVAPAPPAAVGELAELRLDDFAVGVARGGQPMQGAARAEDGCADGREGEAEDLADLLVGEAVHLAQEQRATLDVGQLADVVQELAQLLAVVLHGLGRGRRPDEDAVVRHEDRTAHAEVRHAGVVRDPVQPGPEGVRLGPAAQRRDREDEDLLLDVLGLLRRAQERAAVAQDRRRMPLVQNLERPLVAVRGDPDEALVRTTGEPPVRAPREPGPDLANRLLLRGSLYREHRHVVRFFLASLRRGAYRVTVKATWRTALSELALLPARTCITYRPGFSFDSLLLRSVARNRPAECGVRVVVKRARPDRCPPRAL